MKKARTSQRKKTSRMPAVVPGADALRSNPFHKVFENANDIVALTDRKGVYLYVSLSMKAHLGYSPRELVGTRGILRIHPDDQKAAHEFLKKLLKKIDGEPIVAEMRAGHKDGTWRWFEVSSNNLLREPSVRAIFSSFHDITERKKNDERYSAFISQSTEGIWRYELPKPVSTKWPAKRQVEYFLKYGRVAECNDAFARMYGYKNAAEVINAGLVRFINPKDPEHVKLLYAFVASGYRLTDVEVREFDQDGNVKYFLLNLVGVVEGTEGRRAWGTKLDITARKHYENMLKASEERFRNLADQAPVMIWMAGTNNLTYWFNKTWLDYTGRTLGQEIGNGWGEDIHQDDFERFVDVYKRSFEERKAFRIEYRLRRYDGEYHWVIATGTPLFSPDGAFEGFIGTCLDINEIRIIERRRMNSSVSRRMN
ncbi:MAG TPA: PAS domain S-box protein [Candidatus Paceibacterota bacterium]|nr:PAS domain S-box protein [Candidatus Paceibacterota bacterium]